MRAIADKSGGAISSSPYSQILQSALILCACLLVAAVYGYTQDLIAFGDGAPLDAAHYMQMARQASQGEPFVEETPFVYRIALPYLVGHLFPSNLLYGFWVLNLIAAGITLAVLGAFLLRFTQNRAVILIILLLFVSNPLAPFRFTYFLPPLVDPPALLIMLTILCFHRYSPQVTIGKTLIVSMLSFLGTLVREIVLIAPLSLLCASCVEARIWDHARWRTALYPVLLSTGAVLAGLLGLLIAYGAVTPSGAFPGTYLDVIRRNLFNPSIFALSVFTSFGAIGALLLVQARSLFRDYLRPNPDLLAFLLLIVLSQFIGGLHTDRHLYWAFPVILPLAAVALERLWHLRPSAHFVALISSLVAAQLLAFRVFTAIPTAPPAGDDLSKQPNPAILLFAAYGDNVTTAHVSSAYIGRRSRLILLSEYLMFTGWVYLLFWRSRQCGGVEVPRTEHSKAPAQRLKRS